MTQTINDEKKRLCIQEMLDKMESSLSQMETWAQTKQDEIPCELKNSIRYLRLDLVNVTAIALQGFQSAKVMTNEQFHELVNFLGGVECDNTLCRTIGWMKDHNIQDIRTNVEKIVDLGGHCDCEVLMNAASEWGKTTALKGPSLIGEQEWKDFIDKIINA